MAVKGKRADESAPNPRKRTAKGSSSTVVEGEFGGGKSIGDFSPEDIPGEGNPGESNETPPNPPPTLENDGFDADPNNNPNIKDGSPFKEKPDEEKTDEEKIRDNAADPNPGQLSDEDKKKIIKVPRTPPLPTMESNGDPELEAWATEHEDIQNTIKTMNKRLATLKDFMLGKMQKQNLPRYSHDGFIIEREEKGETIKIKSVKVAEDE